MSNLASTAVAIGVLGDASLQAIVASSSEENKFGLKTYFEKEGRLESLFIAGGMLGSFTMLYGFADPSYNVAGLTLYATVLDLIFRFTGVMPSLDDYYKHWSIPQTIVFAIIPFILVKFTSQLLTRS